MKTLKFKKIITLAVCFVLAVSGLVLPAAAIDFVKDTFIIDGNTYYDISYDLNGNGWSWDVSEFKLTLDGYNSSFIVFAPATTCSKSLKIVIKNNNSIFYNKDETPCPVDSTKNCATSSYECYFCAKCRDIAALFVKNCTVNISGGVLNVKALGKSADAISLSGDSIIENTTLNCTATGTSISTGAIKAKKSTINLDSERAFSTDVYTDECKIIYKNSDINGTHKEIIVSGGTHNFKNSTFEITYGARPDDDEYIWGGGFQGIGRVTFDNTVLKVKKGQHDHPDNSFVLFSLGYPEQENNWLNIKNNSKFELSECITSVFSAIEITISDSTIVGAYSGELIGTEKLNITNSNIDVECKGDEQRTFIETHEVNIKNSKVKAKTKGNLWAPNELFMYSIEKKLTLVDTELDLEGKVEKFGDKWSLKYTTPEKWIVTLDGKQSDLSVNSSKLNLRHEKIVIKINENYKPPQIDQSTSTDKEMEEIVSSSPSTSDSSLVSDVTSSSSATQSTDFVSSNGAADETTGNVQTPKNTKGNGMKIALIVVLSLCAVGTVGIGVFLLIKKKGVK